MVIKTLKSNRGASSVFVVLLLVVLMVFGIAALTIALSHMRLGQKVSDRNSAYYALEGIAWEYFAQTDKTLQDGYAEFENDPDAVVEKFSSLDFINNAQKDHSLVLITYEIWDEERSIGLDVTLTFDTNDKQSLKATKWKQIQ